MCSGGTVAGGAAWIRMETIDGAHGVRCPRHRDGRGGVQGLAGHTCVVMSTITTALIGFGVWVDHMFATVLRPMAMSFFSAASLTIVIPRAVTVFA